MHRRRIAIFSKSFWPEGGGAELATYLIAKTILPERFEVLIVSGTARPCIDGLQAEYFHWPLLEEKLKPLAWAKLFANNNIVRRFIELSEIVYIPSNALLPLAIIARHVKPHAKIVVHIHDYQPISFNSIVFPDTRETDATEVMLELRDHHSLARAIAAGLLAPVNRINVVALMHADRIIFVSKRQREIIVERLPWARGKAVLVPNPLPETRWAKKNPSNTPTFLYMGGSSLVKGFQLVAKAGLICAREYPGIRITITNFLSDKARQLINELNRQCKIFEALGRIDRREVLEVQGKAWSLLFPSLWEEPMGYAVMEAMLSGTIPIASRVGAVPEIVEGTVAESYLFEPGNVDQLVRTMESILVISKEDLIDLAQRLKNQALNKFSNEATKRALFGALSN